MPLIILRQVLPICAKENPIGSDYAGDGERGGAPGDSRLAHVGQRYQQCSPLAESGEYREYFVSKRRYILRLCRHDSDGVRGVRSCRRNSNTHMRGDDHDISYTDLRLALALAQDIADDVTGGKGGNYR